MAGEFRQLDGNNYHPTEIEGWAEDFCRKYGTYLYDATIEINFLSQGQDIRRSLVRKSGWGKMPRIFDKFLCVNYRRFSPYDYSNYRFRQVWDMNSQIKGEDGMDKYDQIGSRPEMRSKLLFDLHAAGKAPLQRFGESLIMAVYDSSQMHFLDTPFSSHFLKQQEEVENLVPSGLVEYRTEPIFLINGKPETTDGLFDWVKYQYLTKTSSLSRPILGLHGQASQAIGVATFTCGELQFLPSISSQDILSQIGPLVDSWMH